MEKNVRHTEVVTLLAHPLQNKSIKCWIDYSIGFADIAREFSAFHNFLCNILLYYVDAFKSLCNCIEFL